MFPPIFSLPSHSYFVIWSCVLPSHSGLPMGFTFMLLPNIIFGILLSSICIYPYHCCSSGLPYYELCYFIFWMYFISKIFIICQMTDVSTRNACPWCPRWPLLPQKFYLSLANCCMWQKKGSEHSTAISRYPGREYFAFRIKFHQIRQCFVIIKWSI